MSEVITFTSGKGGVGKTTTTANVGVGLSLLEKKVILIDTDIALRNLDVLTGRCRVKQAVIRDRRYPNLSVIPSACVREHPPLTTEAMQTLMEELKESYDYILVDSPAGIDSGFDLAVCAADKVVVVTTPQVAAVHDADCVLRLLRRRKDIETFLLINSFRKQLVKEGNMLQISDICELLNTDLLGVVLEDEHIIISQNHGETMFGRKSTSKTCYENICKRLTGEQIPIPDFLQEKHRFRRIFWNKPAKEPVNS